MYNNLSFPNTLIIYLNGKRYTCRKCEVCVESELLKVIIEPGSYPITYGSMQLYEFVQVTLLDMEQGVVEPQAIVGTV